jgi:glycosyltransferase involved in cell wall biosynthesis
MSTRVAVFTDNDFDKTNGVTTTLRALLRYAPEGIEPRIYTCAPEPETRPDYLAFQSPGVGIPFYREMRMYLPRLRAFRRALIDDGVQVLHLTTPGPIGLAARYLARSEPMPLVGSFHTQLAEYTALLSGSPRLGSVMGDYLRWIYGSCRSILVPSADTAHRLVSSGWAPGKMVLWPRGVDTSIFTPGRRSRSLRDRWHVSDRTPAVLYAGRLSREKGLAIFKTLAEMLRTHGVAHRLVFVGDGPMARELRARHADAIFTGTLPHTDVAEAMASADVFVFPSETDTAGNVVLEAQACGLPVLVTDRGGPQENIIRDASGCVCRGGDARDFALPLMQLLIDPAKRTAMARAARGYAQSRSWPEALRPVYDAYHAAARVAVARPKSLHPGTPAPAGA